jgi:hypothetical protein
MNVDYYYVETSKGYKYLFLLFQTHFAEDDISR